MSVFKEALASLQWAWDQERVRHTDSWTLDRLRNGKIREGNSYVLADKSIWVLETNGWRCVTDGEFYVEDWGWRGKGVRRVLYETDGMLRSTSAREEGCVE